MSILDNLQFWKKKNNDPFGDLGSKDSLPSLKSDALGSNHQDPLSVGNNSLSDNSMDSNFVQPLGKDPYSQPQMGLPQQSSSPMPPDITTAFAPHDDPNQYPSASAGYAGQPQTPNHDGDLMRKELEIISSKLDYLKASLETINRRLDNIESASRYEYGQAPRRY